MITVFALTLLSSFLNAYEISYQGRDPGCIKSEMSSQAVVLYKGDSNTLHLAARHDKDCNLDHNNPILFYWKMGKRAYGGKIPCEGLSSIESNFFKLENIQIHQNEVTFDFFKMMDLELFTPKHQVSPTFRMIVDKSSDGKCYSRMYTNIDGKELSVYQANATMRFLALRELTLFFHGNASLTFSK